MKKFDSAIAISSKIKFDDSDEHESSSEDVRISNFNWLNDMLIDTL